MTRSNEEQPASLIADVDSRVRAMQWMIRTLIVLLVAAFGVFWRINVRENQHTRELFTQQIALVQKDVQLVAKDVEYLRKGFGIGASAMSDRQVVVTDAVRSEIREGWDDLFKDRTQGEIELIRQARGMQHRVTGLAQHQNLEDFCALAIHAFEQMDSDSAADVIRKYRDDIRRARPSSAERGRYNGEVTDPFSELFAELEIELPDWYESLASAQDDDDEEGED